MLDLDVIRKRYNVPCKNCDATGVVVSSYAFGRSGCWMCLGHGVTNLMPNDVAAMLAELERLYAAPVAEAVQATTPGEAAKAIAQELHRMLFKPRGGNLP